MNMINETVFSRGYIAQIPLPPTNEKVYNPNANAADPDGINPTVIMILITVTVLAALILIKRS